MLDALADEGTLSPSFGDPDVGDEHPEQGDSVREVEARASLEPQEIGVPVVRVRRGVRFGHGQRAGYGEQLLGAPEERPSLVGTEHHPPDRRGHGAGRPRGRGRGRRDAGCARRPAQGPWAREPKARGSVRARSVVVANGFDLGPFELAGVDGDQAAEPAASPEARSSARRRRCPKVIGSGCASFRCHRCAGPHRSGGKPNVAVTNQASDVAPRTHGVRRGGYEPYGRDRSGGAANQWPLPCGGAAIPTMGADGPPGNGTVGG